MRSVPPVLLMLASLGATMPAWRSVAADNPPVRLIRSTSGTKGSLQGTRFIIEDPRTTFYAGEDRQVVVYFEWEGRPGPRDCKASWKDPSGTVVLTSPFTYKAAGARFAVYWTLALPDSPRQGLWAVEAEVDGHPAGVYTFQIQATRGAEDARQPARRVIGPAELYGRAQAATLTVEALDGRGGSLATGSGFVLDERLVLTAFQLIEGAAHVRVAPSAGDPVEVDELAAWNRRQDWAVLRTPPLGALQLPIDRSRSWKVGDRCWFLDTSQDGARVMADTGIVGAQDFPQAGARLSIAAPVNPRSIGAPLLNEYGEAIAVLGGTLTPGLGVASPQIDRVHSLLAAATNTMGVPLAVLPPVSAESGTKLAELAARGLFVPPLVGPPNVLTGTIARAVEMRNNVPMPVDEKSEFRRSEGEAIAFLTLDPQEKRQGMAVFRIYDIDNRLVVQGRPTKLTLRPRQYSVTRWTFALGPLQPGIYRMDLYMDADPVWRTHFRIVN
jgi:S1-C subfamily serine protease